MRGPPFVDECLGTLVYQCWGLRGHLAYRAWWALKTAPCARAVALRDQFLLIDHKDIDALFARLLTPTFMVHLLDDLRTSGCFSQAETAQLQEAVLVTVSREGHWKP